MARRPKLGQYRHTPTSEMRTGPDGVLRPTRVRRRFPYRGMVFLAYGVFGPLVCAGVAQLFRSTRMRGLLPERVSELPLPKSPSLENVLFGAGLPELVLACGLAGFWLWRILWNSRLPPGVRAGGPAAVLPSLLGQALILGPAFAFAAIPIGIFGLYIRTAPAAQPWAVRPFFALLAAPLGTISALTTGVIPLTLIGLGLLLGAVTALAVAFLWPHFPEEPVLR